MEKKSDNSENGNSKEDGQVAVIMVPLPAQGHLNQLLHLSHILTSYGLPVHYATSPAHARQAKLRLHGWDPEISRRILFHDLELPPFSTPPPDPNNNFPTHLQPLFDVSVHLREPVSKLVQDLAANSRRLVVIHDSVTASVVQDVKSIPNAEAYTFSPVSAFTVFSNAWESMPEKPFQLGFDIPRSVPSNEGCFTPEVLNFSISQHKYHDFQSGRLYDTCRLIEGEFVEVLERLSPSMKHFAAGPFNPVEIRAGGNADGQRPGCLKWLDEQEEGSVMYVSFGSTTSMKDEQARELAIGLERSGHKFIWVVRGAVRGNIFMGDEARSPQLPGGYEERVKGRGIVVRDWAPQLEILAHRSTGGFMSHCGWNSCLESITRGVPIAAWPMHSDQPRNSVLLSEVLRVGMVVRDWAHRHELVTSASIEGLVRRLMGTEEGDEMRKRAARLGEAVRDSAKEGGASHKEMQAFIAHITR